MKQEKLLLPTEQTLNEFIRIFVSRLRIFIKTVVISGFTLYFVATIITIAYHNSNSPSSNFAPNNSNISFFDLFLHTDNFLAALISNYGAWTYGYLFAIVFMGTGLFLTPFLPGNSLIFGVGSLAALGSLNIWLLCLILIVASILGDTVSYSIGHYLGDKAYNTGWIKKEYLNKSHAFFEKHGGKTIFLARFIPIVRTLAPFLAGISKMSYGYFATYNVFSGIVWVISLAFAGYFLGNISLVKNNFELFMTITIVFLVLPLISSWRRKAEKEHKTAG